MGKKAFYFFVILVSFFCICCVSWMRREKARHFRIRKQKWNNQREPSSPECVELAKMLTLKPKRFSEDNFIKLFKEIQKCKWVKNTKEHKKLRLQLEKCCNATRNIIVTQANAPLGTNLSYDAEPKKTFKITENVLNLIPERVPFEKHKCCSVVGNAGILTNSSCGEEINQANFVFRCNLPPLKDYENDVGSKTDIVTSNPTIITGRFQGLNARRKPFLDHVSVYEDAFILLSAFSHSFCTSLSFKALYTVQDFGSKQRVVFLSPSYLKSITQFWKNEGINEKRISSGFIILSAALEMCEEVRLYGFWPFSKDIYGNQFFHHYYDNVLPNRFHSMPGEFYKLMQLHMKGIVKLQVGNCKEVQV